MADLNISADYEFDPNTNLIKSELQVAMSFPYSCSEFSKTDIKLLTGAKYVAKYVYVFVMCN